MIVTCYLLTKANVLWKTKACTIFLDDFELLTHFPFFQQQSKIRNVSGCEYFKELMESEDLPDVAWPAARSAALWAFCRRQNTFRSQRETSEDSIGV